MKRMLVSFFSLLMLLLAFSCKNDNGMRIIKSPNDPNTIKCVGDIPVPKNCKRDSVEPGSFAEYLRNLPLKPQGYLTHLYNGFEKANQNAAFRVVDMDIDTVDLQQCADACIRLYAEYLWHSK